MLAGFIGEFMIEIFAAGIITLSALMFSMVREWRYRFIKSRKNKIERYWSPDESKVCLIAHIGNDRDIYIYDKNSDQTKKLPANAAKNEIPVWSPDSSKIAFVSDRDGDCEIYIWYEKSERLERKTYDPLDNIQPAWSPDGKFLTYFTIKNGEVEASLISAAI